MDCVTCLVTYGSGYQIGTILDITPIVQHLTRPVRLAALPGFIAAAPGTPAPGTCGQLFATTSIRAPAAAPLGSAVCGRNEKLDYCYTVPLIRGESRKNPDVARSPAGRGHMRVVERSRQRIGAVTWRRPDFLQAAGVFFMYGRPPSRKLRRVGDEIRPCWPRLMAG